MTESSDKINGSSFPFIPNSERQDGDIHTTQASSMLLEEVKVVNPSAKSIELDRADSHSGSSDSFCEINRNTWGSKTEYVLSMVGYCVGLGNIWRFPYVCIRNGGGAFLIPFFICLTLCGMPLFFMEVSLGQFVSLSPMHVWHICPLFRGIGISMAIVTFLFAWYYCMVLAWSLIYLFYSFQDPLPWSLCGQTWNSEQCISTENRVANKTLQNITELLSNQTISNETLPRVSSTEEFWMNNVLHISKGMDEFGSIQWDGALALLLQALIVYLCLIKGINTVGKVVYVTATLPYILITILLIKGVTLSGAMDGIKFYLTPDFDKVFLIQTWVEASQQVFYSLGPAWGALITMASYNKFDNNCLKDSLILSFACETTSVFAGFAIFSILGHMAEKLGVEVSSFAGTGPGLAFVVYPEAISLLPLPQLWGVMFFIMLFTLGLDTQFGSCETILTMLSDLWPQLMHRKSMLVKLTYFAVLFCVGLPFCFNGGMYLFKLVDWYFAAYTVIAIALCELIAVAWIYGAERFFDDIEMMISRRPHYVFSVLWRFLTPLFLGVVLVSTLLSYGNPDYNGYFYSESECIWGWILASMSFVPIPAYAIFKIYKTEGTLAQRFRYSCEPSSKYQPADIKHREEFHENNRHKKIGVFDYPCKRGSSL